MWSTGESSPTINIDQAGEYILTVNNGNCISKDTIALTNYCESSIYVPNAFTPNGDGKNEIFKVKGAHIDDFEMLIFNRWGEVIYQSNDIGEGWNGTYLGNQVQQDVYVYKILYSITHTNGKKIKQERIGTVTPIQ
jgi:gliding motility-associated-like protein